MHQPAPPAGFATRRRLLAAISVLSLSAAGCAGVGGAASGSGGRTLSGNVMYRERIALPPGAVVRVALADVSLADAPARIVAQTDIPTDGRSSPFAYTLRYDPARIDPRMRYALQARIELDGRLLFTNTTHHAAFGPDASTDILVQQVSAPAATAALPVGAWLAEDIRGKGVLDRVQSRLEIAADGSVSGHGGCNGIHTRAQIDGDTFSFLPIASTFMACAPAVMRQETDFIQALQDTRGFRVDDAQRKLYLLDAGGNALVRLAAD
ncbi:META domain-containing protein [Verticiella sediminum]|uniref:META domain-containing protein n=1 Tax=Verticiella sediminum TaxID=1247510 RepID=A0A556AWU0_9BURK|nr:YbaY family lipoprotein [Verticiella sediminum]TSH97394.1 META domain-containing protein [Verticiella sediminum]